jgi:hypothetical protein
MYDDAAGGSAMTKVEPPADKTCPKCGHSMTLTVRPRPATGIMFVPPRQWTCTNQDCKHSEDAA